ncbi:hypothetical protein OE88DRAFT_1666893 [Heliocybe sulcata]|uniref:Uncharacterized protein n=1 Tax=Heliocybe sulcata TaxID=5364 RepID=A0A5C3MP20_9AGAM|nr:hypothetical protein OE88DRAFT_1666893 [Heliocybe sulcata]
MQLPRVCSGREHFQGSGCCSPLALSVPRNREWIFDIGPHTPSHAVERCGLLERDRCKRQSHVTDARIPKRQYSEFIKSMYLFCKHRMFVSDGDPRRTTVPRLYYSRDAVVWSRLVTFVIHVDGDISSSVRCGITAIRWGGKKSFEGQTKLLSGIEPTPP